MKEEIINVRNQAIAQISEAGSGGEIDQILTSYLGRNGKLTILIKEIKNASDAEKKEIGILINETKGTIVAQAKAAKKRLEHTNREWFDISAPGKMCETGHLHPVTQAIEEIATIFERIGFVRRRYPEAEWDWFAFGALNFEENHPARDEWETFFVKAPMDKKYGAMLLTPHTSSGQVREMKANNPPIRMINISKCYRRQSDITHVPMFHQFEGLVIDKGINITHLKGTIDYFARMFYGEGAKSRIRPYHFPFTEPSFEVDFSCSNCTGKGCGLCKRGWHETGGAGMVHPNVLRNGGIDPNKYRGFAFGWGVERAFLMKRGVGIGDVRTLYGSDFNYLKQF